MIGLCAAEITAVETSSGALPASVCDVSKPVL
ncbi:Uncharacterised protein [Vibrio cholerae]|nr:Uncharacterised protein [Vibrio cholerae]